MDLKTSVVSTISGVAVPLTVYGRSTRVGDAAGVEIDVAIDWMGNRIDWRKLDDKGASCEDALIGELAEEIYSGEF